MTMTHGGARKRSGPPPQEGSGRSERRGFSLTALPAEGYAGPIPEWPLLGQSDRESAVWEWAWRTPQACAWSLPAESWRLRTVAMWVRISVRCEDPQASAALFPQMFRLADQIGLTTDGLSAMGWKVAVDELAAKAAAKPVAVKRPAVSRDRLKAVSGGSE